MCELLELSLPPINNVVAESSRLLILSTFSTLLARGREETNFFQNRSLFKYFVQDCLSKMGLCGHSFHVSKLFYPIFSLKFHIFVLNTAVIRGGQVHVKTVSHVCHKKAVFEKKILSEVCHKYWLFLSG